jgi:hypothetical protein
MKAEKKYLSTSKHYLSQRFWRFLRHIVPLYFWNFLYSLRQKLLLNSLKQMLDKELQGIKLSKSSGEKHSATYRDILLSTNEVFLKDALVLRELFSSFESDKAVLHNYNYLYSALFSEMKGTCKDILEIGTYKGASLRSWKAFFPSAQVYGIDIDPDTVFEEERIKTMIADQNDLESMAAVNKLWNTEFDVVIDDGWHQPEASVLSMISFIPKLKKKGIYVLEDIDQTKYSSFYNELVEIFIKHGYYAEYLDLPSLVPPTNSGYSYGVLVIVNT